VVRQTQKQKEDPREMSHDAPLVSSLLGEAENPLLSSVEAQEKKSQELGSAFLLGMTTGVAAVGLFFLFKWIFNSQKAATVIAMSKD
jgi:uncharacterized membrane protein YqjE